VQAGLARLYGALPGIRMPEQRKKEGNMAWECNVRLYEGFLSVVRNKRAKRGRN